jgi:hypothetical protein
MLMNQPGKLFANQAPPESDGCAVVSRGRAVSAEPFGVPARPINDEMPERMRDMIHALKRVETWVRGRQRSLDAECAELSLIVLFCGAALAAYSADSTDVVAALCAAIFFAGAAVWFVKLYAHLVAAMQRLVLGPDENARPDRFPGWADVIYMGIGAAPFVAIIATEHRFSYVAIELLFAWVIGRNTLHYIWMRLTHPERPSASNIIDEWLIGTRAPQFDRIVASPGPLISRVGYLVGFALLFDGVALHAYESGVESVAGAQCGQICAAPGFALFIAALCGAGAIVFVALYALLTEAAKRAFIDSWKHVGPNPLPPELPRSVVALHVIIGFAVFFAIATVGNMATPHGQPLGQTYWAFDLNRSLSIEANGFRVVLGENALFELALGWWIGGTMALKFFWWRLRVR